MVYYTIYIHYILYTIYYTLGIGVLYIDKARSKPIHTTPLLHGGGQENGIRSGTESILLIAGLGTASKLAYQESRLLCIHLLHCKLVFVEVLLTELLKHKVQ